MLNYDEIIFIFNNLFIFCEYNNNILSLKDTVVNSVINSIKNLDNIERAKLFENVKYDILENNKKEKIKKYVDM
jgi:hypothetical protein